MNKILIIAELLLVKVWRGRMPAAVSILFLPFILAAWVFEVNNPGFQTTFASDIGTSLLWVYASVIAVLVALDNYWWRDSEVLPWFYLTRTKDHFSLLCGRFLGLVFILLTVLLVAVSAFILLFKLASGIWVFSLFRAAFIIFLELSLLSALMAFFAACFSRIMAFGITAVIVVAGYATESLRSFFDSYGSPAITVLSEIFLVVVPDLDLFSYGRIANLAVGDLMIVSFYTILMIMAYLTAAGIVMRRRNF